MRELLEMEDSRLRAMWDLGASVLSMIANVNRGPNTAPYSPRDFHPFEKKKMDEVDEYFAETDSTMGFRIMKRFFMGDNA